MLIDIACSSFACCPDDSYGTQTTAGIGALADSVHKRVATGIYQFGVCAVDCVGVASQTVHTPRGHGARVGIDRTAVDDVFGFEQLESKSTTSFITTNTAHTLLKAVLKELA